MWRYYQLLSRRSAAEIEALRGEHPKKAKSELAKEIVARYHGHDAARDAEEHFELVHARREVPDDVEERELASEPGGVLLIKALPQLGLASSGSEARRLIAQGGVSVGGERVADPNARLAPGVHLLKVGKRKFTRVTVK
jgi:tyrosyl-tRNA synthetase